MADRTAFTLILVLVSVLVFSVQYSVSSIPNGDRPATEHCILNTKYFCSPGTYLNPGRVPSPPGLHFPVHRLPYARIEN